MDVQNVAKPAASASATHRFEVRSGNSGAVQADRIEISDIEFAPNRPLPAVMDLQLDIDETTKTVVGRIVNPETGEIIKEIPTKEMMRLMARNADLLGALLNKKA